MLKTRWLLAIPLILGATLAPARAASIRDNAGMFDPRAVKEAKAELAQIESRFDLPVTIETIPALNGRNIDDVLKEHARAEGAEGLYILISKADHKIQADASTAYRKAFPGARTRRIWGPIGSEFKKGDFDNGLLAGVRAIQTEAADAKAELGSLRQGNPPQRRAVPAAARPGQNRGTFGIGTLLGIGVMIIAVLIGIRLLGALFGGGGGRYGPGRMGPGYGAPGYGGGGGGFWSGLFGGLGGAIAGNWLYDQFSGRHHGGYGEATSYGQADPGSAAVPDNNDWSGTGGSWDDAGGGGAGGGDWGGGGGGDWGGGGGGDGGGW